MFNKNFKDRHLKLQRQRNGDDRMNPLVVNVLPYDEWIMPISSKGFKLKNDKNDP